MYSGGLNRCMAGQSRNTQFLYNSSLATQMLTVFKTSTMNINITNYNGHMQLQLRVSSSDGLVTTCPTDYQPYQQSQKRPPKTTTINKRLSYQMTQEDPAKKLRVPPSHSLVTTCPTVYQLNRQSPKMASQNN